VKVERLSIKNFRGIGELTLVFDGPQNTTVLVGVNGSGKTAILDCLAKFFAIFVTPYQEDKDNPGRLKISDVKIGADVARLVMSVLCPDGGKRWTIDVEQPDQWQTLNYNWHGTGHKIQALMSQGQKLPLVVMYPVDRVVIAVPLEPRQGTAQVNELDAFEGALDQRRIEFHSFFQWFRTREDVENERIRKDRSYHDPQLDAVRNAIYQLVPGFANPQVRRAPVLSMVVEKDGQELLIDQLSDGEKCLMAMTGDVARRLAIANPNSENPLLGTGVVLIDEIELHLHPAWQRRVVPSLERTFPNLQFIVTTHSPQVLSEVKPENVYVLEPTEDGIKAWHPEATYGRDTNRILEDVLGVSERPDKIRDRLREYFRYIDDNQLGEARELRKELEKEIGPDEPEFVKADVLMRRREILGR
jgi:predicted ATP-binding protein involved in virulence